MIVIGMLKENAHRGIVPKPNGHLVNLAIGIVK